MNASTLFQQLTRHIDTSIEFTGRLTSWLVVFLVLLISYDVAMRYLFHSGSVALQELEWHLFSLIFLIGGAYTLKHDAHVRVDLFYKSHFVSDKGRAWIDFLGNLFFLIPFCLLIITTAWPFMNTAFIHNEASPDSGGLPFRWILKGAIPLAFLMILLQGFSNALKKLAIIMDKS